MKEEVVVDHRDHLVVECRNVKGSWRYGKKLCFGCVHAETRVYADGYRAGCVNVRKCDRVVIK